MRASNESVLLRVRLTPRGGVTAIARYESGVLHVRTTAPPVDGAANRALLELLAKAIGMPKSAISIVRGDTSREKTLRLEGITGAELDTRIMAALQKGA